MPPETATHDPHSARQSSGCPLHQGAGSLNVRVGSHFETTTTIPFAKLCSHLDVLRSPSWSWYIERQDVQLRENVKVQVTGALIRIDEQPVLLARQVELPNQTLTLRDPQGIPWWAGTQTDQQKPAQQQR